MPHPAEPVRPLLSFFVDETNYEPVIFFLTNFVSER
jgi:hypothetical protein